MKKITAIFLFGILSFASDGGNNWRWYPVDCTYQENVAWLFENCSPYEQELQQQAKKGVENGNGRKQVN